VLRSQKFRPSLEKSRGSTYGAGGCILAVGDVAGWVVRDGRYAGETAPLTRAFMIVAAASPQAAAFSDAVSSGRLATRFGWSRSSPRRATVSSFFPSLWWLLQWRWCSLQTDARRNCRRFNPVYVVLVLQLCLD